MELLLLTMLKTEELNSNWLNRFFIVFIFTKAFSSERAFSQTYISNGNFELETNCPQFWSQKQNDFQVQDWYSPNAGTPDFYNSCSKTCNHQNNWLDQNVKSSSASYIGIITQQENTDFSEYVQTKLISNLVTGTSYKISLKVYWPEKSSFTPPEISVLLTESSFNSKKEGHILSNKHIKANYNFDTLPQRKWVTVEYHFEATGNENYLTIGSFTKSKTFKRIQKGNFNYNYLFIDDVTLMASDAILASETIVVKSEYIPKHPNVISSFEYLDEVTSSHIEGHCNCWNCKILNGEVDKDVSKLEDLTDFELRKGQRIDLNKVVFNFENGTLIPTSNDELNRLLFVLEEQPKAELRFVIYTYESNQEGKKIAKESALTIYHYLKEKGLKNSFSYTHATKENLSYTDGMLRDRNIEMYVVNNN